jgi:hypothetical protein
MAAVEPGTPGVGLVARARSILLAPDRTWAEVAGEASTANELYKSYVMPLSAIPPVAGLVGVVAFRGFDIAGVGLQPTLVTSLLEAVMNYALTLVGVFVMAVLIETVAPMFGGGPLERPDARLKAVAALSAPILDIRSLRPGDRLGYGSSFTADAPMRVAIVAAGYADGLLRASRAGGYGWLAGERRRLLIVNMDISAVEIGDAAVQVGETVELLGPNALLDDQATAAGTVAHEVLVRLSRRAERVYLSEA